MCLVGVFALFLNTENYLGRFWQSGRVAHSEQLRCEAGRSLTKPPEVSMDRLRLKGQAQLAKRATAPADGSRWVSESAQASSNKQV